MINYSLFMLFLIGSSGAAPIEWRPVVLMHGLMRTNESLADLVNWISTDFPGIYIRNIQLSNSPLDSLTVPLTKQIELFNEIVTNDPNLARGFNLLGQSQGGLVTRGWVERFNQPPVHNLISWVGPHEGIYGIPDFNALCPDHDCPWLDSIVDALMAGPPNKVMQEDLTVASYWKSPFHTDNYLRDNIFLADINNERATKNETYRKNMISLNGFLLECALEDTIVIPRTSAWFETWKTGSDSIVLPLNQSATYIGDWIGLRTLDEAGKLVRVAVPCTHEGSRDVTCYPYYKLYTRPLLNNTLV
eukprot:TRINITY_DN32243_c0_g1_i1.p1 TRINITY_DN32243_c0_g1~~TRINITY_DN32243_c0_g1_i1.p1  ORF type:complete len:303 (+),score=8.54 TRINITY_DN32243_c0_g1_i1:114-1022(+)